MENNQGITDSFGTVDFSNFTIARGPEGLYTFQIKTKTGELVESDTFTIYMRTKVVEVVPLNSADFQIEFDTPLATQP